VDGWDPARFVRAGELDQKTAQTAALLADRGLHPGDRVVWCARASLTSVPALLGALRAGAVVVPLSTGATAAEVAYVVGDAEPLLALVDAEGLNGLNSASVLHVDDVAGRGARLPTRALPAPAPGDDALIVYTSGTTGKPKGAVHTHGSLAAGVGALVIAWEWEAADRLILTLPLFHVHGLCAGLFGSLAAGSAVTLFDRFDEEAVLDAASAPENTMFFGVPTMYHRLAASPTAGALARLRLCISGSAPLAADLWHRFASVGVPVLERYGMTETLLTLSNPLRAERRPGSVGVPLPAVDAVVEDPDEHGVGELLVRGPSLCRGYWGRGSLSDDGWFQTGDLVSVADDGYVTIRGRGTDLIITGGHNVYPAEVEAVLARHPGVEEVAVIGIPSDEYGETVVAFVVGDLDGDSLRDLALAELATYKCPREVRLVDSLPRNAMGKVVRSQLR